MQGDKGVITQLNKVLTCELTSINQFFLHARLFRHKGLTKLNDKAYKKSIKDMKQAARGAAFGPSIEVQFDSSGGSDLVSDAGDIDDWIKDIKQK